MIKELLESLPQLNKFDEFCNACTYGAEKKLLYVVQEIKVC